MTKKIADQSLWRPRSVAETLEVYKNWAASYDDEVTALGYVTPKRLAAAMADHCPIDTAILDYGCGTGLSGAGLKAAGFTTFDGTDISPEMLDKAQSRGIYRNLWQSAPDEMSVKSGDYNTILASGVISLGAAPASMLDTLLDALTTGGILAFSYNDPTLNDETYNEALATALQTKATLICREHGPHLTGKDMGSDVIILRRI